MIPWKAKIEPYPKQRQAIFDPEGDAIILASPKAGKTIACLQWLIEQTGLVGQPHYRFLWVAPTYGQAKIAFRRAYTELLDLAEINIHKTDHTITLPDETVIFFGSADKPDNIFGEDYHAIVVDEATRVSLEAWIAVTSTTQHTAARMRLIGNNTRRPNWAKKLAISARKGELPGWTYTKLEREDAIAAGVISATQDTKTRLLIPEDEYRILYEGSEVDGGGIHIDTYKFTREPLPEFVIHARGWDLASTAGGDFTVGARIAASSEGYWITAVVRERLDAGDVTDLICRTAAADGPSVDQIIEEEKGASGPLFTDAIKRALYQIPTAGPVWPAPVEESKQVRAWPFIAQVGAGRYHFAPDFHNSEVTTEFEEWPDSANDDIVDAVAAAHNHLSPLVEGMVGSGWTPGQAAS
jgi:phage terminase large subunit-like protein